MQEIAAEQCTSLGQYPGEDGLREDRDWLEVQMCSNSESSEGKFKKEAAIIEVVPVVLVHSSYRERDMQLLLPATQSKFTLSTKNNQVGGPTPAHGGRGHLSVSYHKNRLLPSITA